MNDAFKLDDIRYFLAVAETGSLSGAARRLKVTQPTVGRRIHDLESALDARLFVRMPNGYDITPAGLEIMQAAKAIEENTWFITRKIVGEDKHLRGRVRVATAQGLGICWLSQKVGALHKQVPHVELELMINSQFVDLMRGEADLALRVGKPGSDLLVGRNVGKLLFGLYASDRFLNQHGRPNSLADLDPEFLIGATGDLAGTIQSKKLDALLGTQNHTLRTNNLITQVAAVRAGVGVAALPNYVRAWAPELQRILVGDFEVRLDLWLLTHKDLKFTTRIRAVRDYLLNAIEADAALLFGND